MSVITKDFWITLSGDEDFEKIFPSESVALNTAKRIARENKETVQVAHITKVVTE
jgi:hypothetical protein